MSCAVKGCSSTKRFKPEGVSFHLFPGGELLTTWLTILCIDKDTWTWSKNKFVCSNHFRACDFIVTGYKKYLKVGTVPYISTQTSTNCENTSKVQPATSQQSFSEVTISCESLQSLSTSMESEVTPETGQQKLRMEEVNSNPTEEVNPVCRACMCENGPMESLFNSCELEYPVVGTLSEIFTSCTSLQVEKEDGLPDFLCSDCTIQLKQWFTFRDTCRKSDVKLKDSLTRIIEEGNTIIVDNDPKNAAVPSPTFILLVNNDGSKENMENKDCVNGKSEREGTIKESDVEMEEAENEVENNIRSVSKDHPYAHKEKLHKSGPKHYYYCHWCVKIFTNFKKFQRHISLRCCIFGECKKCQQVFQSRKGYLKHKCSYHTKIEANATLESTNDQPGKTECSTDLETLQSSEIKGSKIISTTNRLLKKDSLKCTHCNKPCKSLWRLKVHMMVHTGERPFMCHVCGKRFSQKTHLHTHYFTHTGIKNYICEVCGKKFATISFLKTHMRHHGDTPKKHSCTYCSKTFFVPSELKAHITTHTGERPFKCLSCSKTFRLKSLLKAHQLRHGSCELRELGRPHWCTICSRSFTTEIYLQNHMESVHPGGNQMREFLCKICGKEFRSKNNLKVHSLRHSIIRPFSCTICNRDFREEANLIAHVKYHARPKPFKCETCHKCFIDRGALRVHHRTHTGEKPFACELCEKRFTVKRSLEAHMRCHTGEKPFECAICKNAFSQRCSLQTHMLLLHNCEP